MKNTLGVIESDKHEKYLGLLAVRGRSKQEIFATIRERVWKKVKGWKEKLLSRAGRKILIKAVAQACPMYASYELFQNSGGRL